MLLSREKGCVRGYRRVKECPFLLDVISREGGFIDGASVVDAVAKFNVEGCGEGVDRLFIECEDDFSACLPADLCTLERIGESFLSFDLRLTEKDTHRGSVADGTVGG